MSTDLIPFRFHDDELLLVDVDGKAHLVLKPAVEGLGLDYATQYTKLRRRSWATVGQSPTVGADGRSREMVTVDVRTFLMLLATIDETRVAKDVAPKLRLYQAEVADAIEAYWTQGGAINPRATAEQLDAFAGKAKVLAALKEIVDPGWLEAKARILAAQALGETPQLDPATKPLTVSIYLTERGMTRAQIKAVQSNFGKRLKATYRGQYDAEPPVVEDVEGRHTITVAQYQERHRPLFDRVWRQIEGAA